MRPHAVLIAFLATSLAAQNLTVQKSNTTENLRGISVLSDQIAWASGTHGTYLRTTDGGTSWHVAQVPNAEALDFRDAIHGVIAGGDYKHPDHDGPHLAYTNDGGVTWALSPVSPQVYFSAVAFVRRGSESGGIVIVGSSQSAYEDDLAKTSRQKTTLQKSWDLNLNAVSVSPTGEAIAVGPKGLIVRIP